LVDDTRLRPLRYLTLHQIARKPSAPRQSRRRSNPSQRRALPISPDEHCHASGHATRFEATPKRCHSIRRRAATRGASARPCGETVGIKLSALAPAGEPSPPRETAKDEPANLDVQLEGKPFDTATRRPVEIIESPKRADTRERLPLAEKAAPPAVPNSRSSGASAANEAVPPALPVGRAKVGTLTSDKTCKRDEDRLVRLRLSPSGEEAQRLASELSCAALRPQVQRLMESLGLVGAALSAPNDLSR
jgi:hypothetical protein